MILSPLHLGCESVRIPFSSMEIRSHGPMLGSSQDKVIKGLLKGDRSAESNDDLGTKARLAINLIALVDFGHKIVHVVPQVCPDSTKCSTTFRAAGQNDPSRSRIHKGAIGTQSLVQPYPRDFHDRRSPLEFGPWFVALNQVLSCAQSRLLKVFVRQQQDFIPARWSS
nr:hypothetical protein CFP56_41415 [Quercus suber]